MQEFIGVLILSACIGGLTGSFAGLLFIQFDKGWKKILLFLFSGGSYSTIFLVVKSFTSNNITTIYSSILYIVFLATSFIIVLSYLLDKLKNQNENFKLRTMDILIGYNKVLNMYYDSRKQEVDNSFKGVEEEKNKITKQQKELEEQQKGLTEKQRVLDRLIVDKVNYIILPINKPIPIENSLLEEFPYFTGMVSDLIFRLESYTIESIKYYNNVKRKDKKVKIDHITGYFKALCYHIAKLLFGQSSVRVHVRYKNGDNYIKLATSDNSQGDKYPLTTITGNSNLICKAAEVKCSLIKSLNPEYHWTFRGKSARGAVLNLPPIPAEICRVFRTKVYHSCCKNHI
jgi:hypothetical protein